MNLDKKTSAKIENVKIDKCVCDGRNKDNRKNIHYVNHLIIIHYSTYGSLITISIKLLFSIFLTFFGTDPILISSPATCQLLSTFQIVVDILCLFLLVN